MKKSSMRMGVIVVLAILVFLFMRRGGVSTMRDLSTTSSSGAPGDLFGLKYGLDCTPSGFNKNSAYYTKSMTPGGACGDMNFVRNQERSFTIDSGIGGSLLAK
jgi:hypothetical protein